MKTHIRIEDYLKGSSDPMVRAAGELFEQVAQELVNVKAEKDRLIAKQILMKSWLVTCEEYLRSTNKSISIKLRKFLKEEQ